MADGTSSSSPVDLEDREGIEYQLSHVYVPRGDAMTWADTTDWELCGTMLKYATQMVDAMIAAQKRRLRAA